MIYMIWAMDENRLIGNGDKIPWHVREDLIYYKNRTRGQTVLMGEATYYSLKGYYKDKPLPYKTIYVASLTKDLQLEDAIVVSDIHEFLSRPREECLWVVGGATIYELALPYAHRLYISFIKGEHTGDKYFPAFDFSKYRLIWSEEGKQVRYTIYERI